MTDTGPAHPFLARLIGAWPDVLAALPEPQRQALVDLLVGTTPPADRMALVGDLLQSELPRDHPVRATLFGFGVPTRRIATAADLRSWERLAALASSAGTGLGLGAPVPRSEPAAAAEPGTAAPAAGTAGRPTWRDLHRRVRERLAGLDWRPAADVRDLEGADALIRLRFTRDDVRVPAFQFDRQGRPHPLVLQVNRLLGADRDPWGVTCWWVSPHPWLGAVPADIIGSRAGEVLDAARSVLED